MERELRHFVVLRVQSLSCVHLFVTPWTVVHLAPLSKGFPRQEFCSRLSFPSPGNLPYPGIEPTFPALAGGFFTTEPPGPRHFLTWFKFHDQSKSIIANTLNSLGQISICILFFLLFRCPVESNSLQPHGLQPARLLWPWDFLGKNSGVGCHFLLQGIFPTRGSNPHLLHWKSVLYCWATGEAPLSRALLVLLNKRFREKQSWFSHVEADFCVICLLLHLRSRCCYCSY